MVWIYVRCQYPSWLFYKVMVKLNVKITAEKKHVQNFLYFWILLFVRSTPFGLFPQRVTCIYWCLAWNSDITDAGDFCCYWSQHFLPVYWQRLTEYQNIFLSLQAVVADPEPCSPGYYLVSYTIYFDFDVNRNRYDTMFHVLCQKYRCVSLPHYPWTNM